MKPIDQLRIFLQQHADENHFLFQASDFSALFPRMSAAALKMLLGRAVKNGILERVCRGVYCYDKACRRRDMLLYQTAAKLRAGDFCYLSFESVLSEAGLISQIPLNWITLMTGGRSGVIGCGVWGHIEFIHTRRKPADVARQLVYDADCGLWRASPQLALRDMRAAKRPLDLVNDEENGDAF